MEKETSCINSRAILDYVKENYHGDSSFLLKDLDEEINALPDPEGFLRDPNNWISCEVIARLYRRARNLLNDEEAPYKMARFAFENASLGYAQRIIAKSFWSLKNLIRNAQKLNDKWNRNKKVEVVNLGRKNAVLRLHWNDEMACSKDICAYNQGAYASMPLIWGGEPVTLDETCCHFEGAPYCEYHIKWPASNRLWEITSRIFKRKSVLMDTISEMEKGKQIIEQKYEEVNRLNRELNLKFKQLLAVQDTGKAILSVLDLDELLSVIMNILSEVCRINRAIIMLVNTEKSCLEYIHGAGFEGPVPDEIKAYTVPLGRVENIISRVAGTGQPEYVPEVKLSGLRKGNIILSITQPTSVFVAPLITRSRVVGVIAIDAVNATGVPKETQKTLEIFAPQIAIAIQNAKLYSKLQEQMVELKKSKALLKRAEKLSYLGNVAARLAHEIKNPMTAIVTFMQMLPAKYDDEEFRKDFYAIAMEETGRINNLITELLDLAKTRELNFESINLHGLIKRMIRLVSAKSLAKKIEVAASFDPDIGSVVMDSEKMTQVLLNILSNAVEFTPERGRIKISTNIGAENKGSRKIRIEISDNGPGIDPAMADRIFDPYFTTKHKSDMHRGTGLGLFIAHQNMRDHGGNIEVSSHPDQGTVFLLTLPDDGGTHRSDLNPKRIDHAN